MRQSAQPPSRADRAAKRLRVRLRAETRHFYSVAASTRARGSLAWRLADRPGSPRITNRARLFQAKRLRVRLRSDLRRAGVGASRKIRGFNPCSSWFKNPTARAVRDNRALPSNGRVLADAATDGFAHEDASGIFALLSFFAATHPNPARSEIGPYPKASLRLRADSFSLTAASRPLASRRGGARGRTRGGRGVRRIERQTRRACGACSPPPPLRRVAPVIPGRARA